MLLARSSASTSAPCILWFTSTVRLRTCSVGCVVVQEWAGPARQGLRADLVIFDEVQDWEV